jgi:hypothetical protein
MSKRSATSKILEPLAWLGAFGLSLGGLVFAAPGLAFAIISCCVLSIALTLLATRKGSLQDSKLLPWAGAVLLANIAWITVLLLPVGGQDAGVIERLIVVLSAGIILMPILAFVEMMVSTTFVMMISKAQGKTDLGSELQIVALLDRKFGGLLGTINR